MKATMKAGRHKLVVAAEADRAWPIFAENSDLC
jgi:hypothetical protein